METYVSIDVETDGPIPGPHSMLSLGAASFDHHGRHILSFEVNLETLPGAVPDPETIRFWNQHPKAYKATRVDMKSPKVAMEEFDYWLHQMPNRPVLIGYPITFDFMFVYWYMMKFVGKSCFSFSGLDIKTLVHDRLKTPYRDVSKKTMPSNWLPVPDPKLKHHALKDAIAQGHLFFRVKEHR